MFGFFSSFFFIVSFVVSLQANVHDYTTGKNRISLILKNKTAELIDPAPSIYAHTQNLNQDLHLNEVVEFFGCKTTIGKAFFKEMLQFPLSSAAQHTLLHNRKKIIETLVLNPELHHAVSALLDEAKQLEDEVIILMSDLFVGENCPDLMLLERIKKENPFFYPFHKFFITSPKARMGSLILSYFGAAATSCYTGLLGYQTSALIKAGAEYGIAAAYTGYMGFLSGIQGYGLYKDYSTAAIKRKKIHALSRLMTIAEQIDDLCLHYGMVNSYTLRELHDVKTHDLMTELKKSRYAQETSYVFLTPLVHTFLYSLYEHDKHLAPIFACIAEIDCYNAVATKMIEKQNTPNSFCFSTFVEKDKPYINAQAFWNVLVASPVVNSLTENRHIILTGPNAGGKTTAIGAILQNIILSQTFGIAAAQKFEYTYFDSIHSYLNISDDILHGVSRFASELKRAQAILQHIQTRDPRGKFFFALDELFTGTVAEDGEQCAYKFIEKASSYPGVQCIYATHFNELKKLEKHTKHCVNYKIDAPKKNEMGKLVYPYTLSKGANTASVALDLAREANLFA